MLQHFMCGLLDVDVICSSMTNECIPS